MTISYIALGSNLQDPLHQAKIALTELENIRKTRLISHSQYYRSKPLGPQDQPDYLNMVVKLGTQLSAEALLDELQRIEQAHGRVRKQHWGARTLDLDILLYGNQTIQTTRLTIPHYDMKRRAFVLYPLAEIAPDLLLPDNTSISQLLAQVNPDGLTLWIANEKLT